MIYPYGSTYSRAMGNIEYHYGRDSLLYQRLLEFINSHVEYGNKLRVNELLDKHGLRFLRGYYYREYSKNTYVDDIGEPFEAYLISKISIYLPFSLLYKKIGEFHFKSLFSNIYPSLYRTFFHYRFTEGTLKAFSNNFPDIYFDIEQMGTSSLSGVAYYYSFKEIFDFGEIIYVPTYYITGIDEDMPFEYAHTAFIRYYEGYDDSFFDDKTFTTHLYQRPSLSKCCLAECFGITNP